VRFKLPLYILIIYITFTLGFASSAQENEGLRIVTVQASWIPNGQFAFVCSAIVEGYYEDVGLDVRLRAGGPAISFARSSTILAQNNDIDISVESVLTEYLEGRARAGLTNQLRVKAIGAFWQDNPLGFLIREDGPSNLEDLFTGTKADGSNWVIGASPDAVMIEALAEHFGVSYSDLQIVTTGFNATPFLVGQVDALWGFWTTQAYEAFQADVPYRFLSLNEVPGFGQPSNIILVRENTLEMDADMLATWFEATIYGAEFVVANPQMAAEHVLDERCGGPDFDYEQELWLIEQSLPLFDLDGTQPCLGIIEETLVSQYADTYLNIVGRDYIPNIEELVDPAILQRIYGEDFDETCVG